MNNLVKKFIKDGRADDLIVKTYYAVMAAMVLITMILLVREFRSGQNNEYYDEYVEYNAMKDYIEIETDMKTLASNLSLYIDCLIENDDSLESQIRDIQMYADKIVYGDPYTESLNPDAATLDFKIRELSVMVGEINNKSEIINNSVHTVRSGKLRSFIKMNRRIDKSIDDLNIEILTYNNGNNEQLIKINELIKITK